MLHSLRLLDGVRRSAAIDITRALRTFLTKALFTMRNYLSTELFAKQEVSERLNTLSHWHVVPSGHSSIFKIDPAAPLDID